MKRFRKENIPIRGLNTCMLVVVCILFFLTRSCNRDYDLLSSKKTGVGIAIVYDYDKGKSTHYKYIYQVDSVSYFGEVSSYASRMYINENRMPQSFYIVYNSENPARNVLIYQKPLPLSFNLDTLVPRTADLDKFIKRNTLDAADGDKADQEDGEEMSIYRKKLKKWKK